MRKDVGFRALRMYYLNTASMKENRQVQKRRLTHTLLNTHPAFSCSNCLRRRLALSSQGLRIRYRRRTSDSHKRANLSQLRRGYILTLAYSLCIRQHNNSASWHTSHSRRARRKVHESICSPRPPTAARREQSQRAAGALHSLRCADVAAPERQDANRCARGARQARRASEGTILAAANLNAPSPRARHGDPPARVRALRGAIASFTVRRLPRRHLLRRPLPARRVARAQAALQGAQGGAGV